MLAVLAAGQKKPAAHAFAVALVLPAARQKPAPHATHAAAVVADVPPAEYVPGGQAWQAEADVLPGSDDQVPALQF